MKIVEITKSGLNASKEIIAANINHIILYEDSRPYKLVAYFANNVYKTFEFATTDDGLDMYDALVSFWLGEYSENNCWCFSINVDKNGIVSNFVFDKVMEKDEQLKKKLDEIIDIGESNYARGNKIDMLKELLHLR